MKVLTKVILLLLFSVTVFAVLPKHFWDVIIDNDLTVGGQTPTATQWGYVGGADQAVKTTDSPQFDGFDLNEVSTPTNPVATRNKLYFKADGNLYRLDDTGIEKKVGSGGGGSGGINLLVEENFNCEDGSPPINYTASGGTFTAETVNPGFDSQSCSWDSSALAQTLRTTAVTIPEGLYGRSCSARIQAKTTVASEYTFRVEDSSDTLIAENTIETSSEWFPQIIFFTCPTSGDIRIEIESDVADAALILLDNFELGQVGFVGIETNQTEFVLDGPITIGAVTTAPTKGTTTVDRVYWKREGQDLIAYYEYDQTAAGVIGSGDYLISLPNGLSMDTSIITVNTVAGSIETQTTTIGEFAGNSGGSFDHNSGHAVPYSATQFRIVGRIGGGTSPWGSAGGGLNNTTVTIGGWIRVPIQGWTSGVQEGITLETVGWKINTGIQESNDGIISLGTTAEGSYGVTSDADLSLVEKTVVGISNLKIACAGANPSTGDTCSAGNENGGIAFSNPYISDLFICVGFQHRYNGTGLDQAFRISRTSDVSDTEIQTGIAKATSQTNENSGHQYTICDVFSSVPAGLVNFKIFERTVAVSGLSSNSIKLSTPASALGMMSWTVIPVGQQMLTPVFTEVVKKIDANQSGVRQVSAHITNTGTPTVTAGREYGDWIDTLGDNAAGDTTINIKSGIFDSTPNCTCSAEEASLTRACGIDPATATSNVLVRVNTSTTSSNVLFDADFHIICTGLRP